MTGMHQICWFVISSIFCDCGQDPAQPSTRSGRWAYIIGQSLPPVNCLLTTLSAQTRLACDLQPPDHKIRAEDGSLQRL